ncbi:MAG: RHS repeat-associated core domain-containing protein [Chloroflexota bacterium]
MVRPLGYVAATRDPRGTVTRHVTDAMGRETRTIVNCTDSGTTPTSTPTTCTGGGTHDASTNVVTDMTYDARGSLLSSTIRHQSDSSKDVRTEHTYDDAGNRTITVVDAGSGKLALTTRTAYDDLGNAIAEFDPLGTTTVRDYDAGNVVEEIRNCTTDSTGTITGMSSGNFASCDGSGTANATWNVTTTNDYDDLGQLVTEVASNLRKTTTSYDDAGRVTSVVDNDVASPSGNEDLETTYAYDDDGNQTGVRAPTSSRTTFGVTRTVYDELGRVTSVTASCTSSGTTVPSSPACTAAGTADASHNITTTTAYDAVGNVLSLEMPDPAAGTGSTTTITTRYAYDGAGRLCRVLENASTDLQGLADPCTSSVTSTSDGNVSTRYGYDKAGNLVTATDAEGSTQTYAFDRLGRMTSRTDGLGATESWSYDVRGNRLTLDGRIAGSSDLVTWTYDAADRMLTRVADGNTTSYGYDANGNMTSAAVAAETISVTYDRLDRPLLVTPGSGATTEYGYTSFTLLERDDPSGALDFGLDKWGRQTTMKVGATTVDTVAWRPDGLVASSANVDGNTNARTYDAAGRLTEIRLAAGGTTRADIDYTYNRAGLARTEATASINAAVNGTASFAYDHLGRLTGYDSPMASAADRDYAWKRVASRSSVTSDPSGTPSTLTYTLDAADRITADSASGTYGTDASGRVTARPSRQFVWNSLGRLTTVKDGSGTTITTYTYDALDRVRSYTSSGTTWILRYVGTTSSIALVRDDTAGTTERLLLNDLAGQPWGYLSASGTGRVSWLLNAHHDTVATYDSSGALGRYYRYTPDGAFAASGGTGATPTTRFQSSWYDGTTGLYWVVSRWYDPATARFLSEDSLLGEPSNPDSRHRYAYGEGDPVNAWDPDGRARLKLAHVRIESRIYDCCNIQLTRALLVVSWHYDGRRITDYRGTMTATYHREAGYFTGWSLGSKRTYDRCLRHHIGGCASRGLGFVAEFNYFGIFTPGLPWATHHNVHRAAVVIRGNGTHTWEAGVQYRDTFFWHWRIYYNGRLVRHGSA